MKHLKVISRKPAVAQTNFARWKQFLLDSLDQLIEFIFLERPGHAVREHPDIPGLRLLRCDGHLLAINSTELRDRVRRGLSLDYFVPHKAIVYIKEKRLYLENNG